MSAYSVDDRCPNDWQMKHLRTSGFVADLLDAHFEFVSTIRSYAMWTLI